MALRPRIYYNAEQKAEMWDRWQRGESLTSIGRGFDRPSSSIFSQLSPSGGIKATGSLYRGSTDDGEEYAGGDRRADDAGYVRAHRMHQQEVLRVCLQTDLVGNARCHRYR